MHRRLTHSWVFWDAAIALVLLTGVAGCVVSFLWIATHTISWLIAQAIVGLFGTLSAIGALLVIRGSFIEPQTITVNTKNVHIKGLPALKIAIIGDPHVGPYKGKMYLRRVVKKVNALKPDVIVLPGDFIYDSTADISKLSPFKDLHATHGVFAVLGNHDTGHMLERVHGKFLPYRMPDRTADIVSALQQMNIVTLRNAHTMINVRGKTIALAGSDHYWMKEYDLRKTFKDIPDAVPVILLSHIPDVILDERSARASLILSGHTHGGQIRLPFIGPLYPIPDDLGRTFDQGLFRLKNGNILAITHGIGETMARARLFCPPEILLLRNKE